MVLILTCYRLDRLPLKFYKKNELEAPGIDPGTSRMLSEHSTI